MMKNVKPASRASSVRKVGTLPLEGSEKEKQTHEIKTAIPLLDAIEIRGKTLSADALLTQRDLARYLVEECGTHYHLTVKGNQNIGSKTSPSILNNLQTPDITTTDGDCEASA